MKTSGRFSEANMTAAMRDIAGLLGVPADDAQLLQMTNNAVFALPSVGIVIRISRSLGFHERVAKVIRLAQWFAEVNAPTIRLMPELEQPVRSGDVVASVWQYVPPNLPPPTAVDLGRTLREFHELGIPPLRLPIWDPVDDARLRISAAQGLTDQERSFFVQWCDRLEPEVAALRERTTPQVLHADAHPGNLLRLASGQVVLCDFDATCIGPRQVDLAAVAVSEIRFGPTGAHAALAEEYGTDVTIDPDWHLLREARELKMIAAGAALIHDSPEFARELAIRLESVATGDESARWTPFAKLRGSTKASARLRSAHPHQRQRP